jgi:2-amino-1-hydroxyethylphosphonate dioxygenase (glycine-forming)
MKRDQAIAIADEIIKMYSVHGHEEYAGEKVTQLEHMVQAAQLAEQQGHDDEVVLAAFLHDIGHICVESGLENNMDGWGIKDHEEVGADFLKQKGFSKKVIRLVESHVEAKRYLTRREPGYYEQLSEASKKTLEFQGGRMSEEEADAFEKYPLFQLIIGMRRWDEAAKVTGLPVPELERFRNLIINHLTTQDN